MTFSFTDVRIAIFDVHAANLALEEPANEGFQAPFDCLLDPDRYQKFHQSDARLGSGSLVFHRLNRTNRAARFWQAYLAVAPHAAIPLVCRTTPLHLELRNPIVNASTTVHSEVYLTPLGWSTHVLLDLKGDLLKRDLIDLMGGLRSGPQNPQNWPLLLGGNPARPTDVFIYYQDLLLNQVYNPQRRPHVPGDFTRHYLFAVRRAQSPQVEYPQMAQADQALMQSLVYGRRLDAGDVKGPGEIFYMKISGVNFALTDIDDHTLLFPQRDAQKPDREAATHCLAENVRHFLTMANLLRFSIKGAPPADSSSLHQQFREQAEEALAGLPDQYKNEFCQQYYRTHNLLSDIRYAWSR
jgi:hypothetical protein